MQSKLGLDSQKISHAKQIAKNIAGDVQNFVDGYTTVTVERTVCRLLGIDGVDANGVPLPNVVVDHLKNNGILGEGIMFWPVILEALSDVTCMSATYNSYLV